MPPKKPLTISVWSAKKRDRSDAVEISIGADGSYFYREEEGDYSWRMRATVEHAGVTRQFFAGDDSDFNHEPISEFPPHLQLPWFRIGDGPIELLVELRVRRGKQSGTFAGRATFAPGESATISAGGAGKLVGPAFDPPDETIEHDYKIPDHHVHEITVPDVGLLVHDGEVKSDFESQGTRMWLYSGETTADAPRKDMLFIPGNSITQPGEKYPKNWRHFDTLEVAPTGWVVLHRTQRDPWRNSFTAFHFARPDERIDIDDNHLHTSFELTGQAFWFTVDKKLRILHLASREVITLDQTELVTHFPYGGAIHVDGTLLCGVHGEDMTLTDWTTNQIVDRHKIPSFDARPLWRVLARRVAWVMRLGNMQGPLSVLRWMALDASACGDVLVPDMLLDAVMLDDGRVVVSGKLATWIVDPGTAEVRRLGPSCKGEPVVTGTRGHHRWHLYDREKKLVVEL